MHEVAVLREVEVALERPVGQRLESAFRFRSLFLLLFLLFLFSLIPLQVMAVRLLAGEVALKEQVGSPSFLLSLRARATDTQIVSFRDALLRLPYVKGVTHETREQAYAAEADRHPDVTAFLEERSVENPFTDTITAELRSLQDLQVFQEFLKRSELQSILEPAVHSRIRTEGENLAMQTLAHRSSRQGLFVTALLFAALFFLVSLLTALLRLQRDRQTVLLKSLAGTPPSKIAQPIILEAVTLLGAALIVASAFVSFFVFSLPSLSLLPLRGNPSLLPLVRSSLYSLGVPILLLEFLILSGIAVLGMHVALRMVVRKEEMIS